MSINVIRVGDIYRHFKNQFVIVDAIGKHTETEEDMVVYHHLNADHAQTWVRPLSMWFDKKIDGSGHEVPRFSKMELVTSIPAGDDYIISYGDTLIRQMDKSKVTVVGIYKTNSEYYIEYQDSDSKKFIISLGQMLENVTDSDGVVTTAFTYST